MNLASQVQKIEPQVRASPWAGYEHYRGYAVMILPFSSGHLLGLRVFPENDFAPYKSVWHRTPGEAWSIYNDGPSLETTCPRWWGPALEHAELTPIELTWTGPNELRVEMEAPSLVWTMSMTAPPLLRLLNAASAILPPAAWKLALQRRIGEWMARQLLSMGDIPFAFATPSEQDAILIPRKIVFIDASEATWQGRDLGEPVQLPANPTIGGIPLPTRPTFVIGQAHARIKDPKEYQRTRQAVRAETSQ
ncbi:MAG: hypothetical protein PVJ34_12785 [Anaerolineae bacterium]|jgi:hypothetical protein